MIRPALLLSGVFSCLVAAGCACSLENAPRTGSANLRVTRVELVTYPAFREPIVVRFEGCGELESAVRVLETNGFFAMEPRYEDPLMADGFVDQVRVVFENGSEQEVVDKNANEPRFRILMRAFQNAGLEVPRTW